MNETFEKNIRIIEDLWPDVYSRLEKEIEIFRNAPKNQPYLHVLQRPGFKTNLVYTLADSQNLLYHAPDPEVESRMVIEKTKLENPQMVFIFGVGLGYLLLEYLNIRPQSVVVTTLIEKDPQIFLRALTVHDFSKALLDPNLVLLIGYDEATVGAHISDEMYRYTTVSRLLKILPTPGAMATEGDYYGAVAQAILRTRDSATLAVGNSVEDSYIGFQNIVGNAYDACKNPGLDVLKNSCGSGRTALAVAAGPSADEHWDAIRELQGKIPIIACDTLLKAMLKKGIVPDLVSAIERTPIVTGFFKDVVIPERSALVGPLVLLPQTWKAFRGEHIMYCPTVQNAAGLGLQFLGVFYPGSSAGNLNISTAVHLGFENIIMIGQNLAYGLNSRTSHVKGTYDIKQETPMTETEMMSKPGAHRIRTQDGEDEVISTIFWKQFREQIECLIAMFPDKKFINTAPKGAKIIGANLMSLQQALDQYRAEDFDFYELRKSLYRPVPQEEVDRRRQIVNENIAAAVESIRRWKKESLRVLKKLHGWRSEIQERERQGRKVSVHFLDDAIDEVLKLKVRAVNEDPAFYQHAVNVFFPAHTTFEREVNSMPALYKDNYLLKRDFLMKHALYFEIWEQWLPRFEFTLSANVQNNSRPGAPTDFS